MTDSDPEQFSLIIDGDHVPATTDARLPVTDPASGETFVRAPDGNADDVDRAV